MNAIHIPLATYRLQFHAGFRFSDAEAIVPYLNTLGISDVYSSPLLTSRPGSMHGYDVIDHSQINPELGGREELNRLTDALRERRMGMIVDVVPNHMEIDDPDNRWWQDVLQGGPSSAFAHFFDIDWKPPKYDLSGRVLLPVLGDQFGKTLENGEITLNYEDGGFYVHYYERTFPIDPRTAAVLLETAAKHVRFTTDADDPDLVELESIATALSRLPNRGDTDPDVLRERRRETGVAKRRLTELADNSAAIRRAIEGVVVEWSGRAGDPDSFDHLEELLSQQAYRLCHWRVAADEINYRRFFDINDLAAIRVEDGEVFARVHEIVLKLVSEGRVTGLRIDHPDGLYDPVRYFADLQRECARALPAETATSGRLPGKVSPGGLECAMYVAAEKILSHNEQLPLGWAVHGTSGYEMLNLITGVLVNRQAEEPLSAFWRSLSGKEINFEDLVYETKKLILKVAMSSELHVLARRLDAVSEQHRYSRDFTLWSLHDALREVVACFPVYRTYVTEETTVVTDEDRRHVERAIAAAKARNPSVDRSIFDFVESVLLLESADTMTDEDLAERRRFVMKLQQVTGPVMAKGLEDTAFYRVYPLSSLNEVGGEPEQFGASLEEFHRVNTVRAGRWPYGMIASSTHDTKRSEDVRAWINVLSETPTEWIDAVRRWQALNHDKKEEIRGRTVPDPVEEYLLYQTLIGLRPLVTPTDVEHLDFIERMVQYMEKALREAKIHTSWINPDNEYEQAIGRFVRSILSREPENPFLDDVEAFRGQLDIAGACNALSQALLKMCAPGVPDFYQGCELWSFCLVDPDNRRPVDFELRKRMLDELIRREGENITALSEDVLEHWRDGRIKMFTTYRALGYRHRAPDVFLEGEYIALEASGAREESVVAFVRQEGEHGALVAVPRLIYPLTRGGQFPLGHGAWEDTKLTLPDDAPKRWRNIFTGEERCAQDQDGAATLELGQLFERFPIALLESID